MNTGRPKFTAALPKENRREARREISKMSKEMQERALLSAMFTALCPMPGVDAMRWERVEWEKRRNSFIDSAIGVIQLVKNGGDT